MVQTNLDELSAKFEIAFRCLESDRFQIEDKLTQIDVFADYLYERREDDYINGQINEDTEVFAFIDNMINNVKDCREIIRQELEDREEFELLAKIVTPISNITEKVIEESRFF